MTFLLDENFPISAVGVLTGQGHVALRVLDLAAQGIEDRNICELAQQTEAVLSTTDRDFFHTIPYLFATHHGVIGVALKRPNRAAILSRTQWILAKLSPSDFRNRVFQVRDTSCVAVPPPP